MAKQPEEKISRRLGRVEMLLTDLAQIPEGYQPTEREVALFKELVLGSTSIFAPATTVLVGSTETNTPANYEASLRMGIPLDPEILQVLGLQEDATPAEIKDACLVLAQGVEQGAKKIEELLAQATSLNTELAQAKEAAKEAAKKAKKD